MNNTEKETLLLLNDIKNGGEKAYCKLHKQYTPLITAMVSRFSGSVEQEEAMQLASIGLFEAAMSYNISKADKITFGLYAEVCIKNRLISEVRRLKSSLSLEENEPSNVASPEDDLIRREDILFRLRLAQSLLTPYERKVFGLYIAGKSYGEIAEKLGKTVKSVDNALSRIKAKFKNQNANLPE